MPKATIIVPAFNVARTLPETLKSLMRQTYEDYEIIIVDDGSCDDTVMIAKKFCNHPRVRLVQQPNRGLAGARNTGIEHARGRYIGFCDADDLWKPEKLAAHVSHLDAAADVGLSFSRSELIDDASCPTGHAQRPRLRAISPAHVFKRNPIGNGSSAVLRLSALKELAFRPRFETPRNWYFDETFRQSEDIECWLRLMLTTDWVIEGVPGLLTGYRINHGGLSAGTDRQLAAWERMVQKLRPLAPEFFERHAPAARAYQLRYLSRRALSGMDPQKASRMFLAALGQSLRPMFEEPVKTAVTASAIATLAIFGPGPVRQVSRLLAATKFRPF